MSNGGGLEVNANGLEGTEPKGPTPTITWAYSARQRLQTCSKATAASVEGLPCAHLCCL